MGSVLKCFCQCGYQEEVVVASGRKDHGKIFYYPHACYGCRSVVSIDILSSLKCCPNCLSEEVSIFGSKINHVGYGLFERLIARLSGRLKKTEEARKIAFGSSSDMTYCYPHNATYVIPYKHLKCPNCMSNGLLFEPGLLFD